MAGAQGEKDCPARILGASISWAIGDGEGNLSQGSRIGGDSLVGRWALPALRLLLD